LLKAKQKFSTLARTERGREGEGKRERGGGSKRGSVREREKSRDIHKDPVDINTQKMLVLSEGLCRATYFIVQ